VVVWDAATGQRRYTMASGTSYMGAIAFSPDGTILATGQSDNAIHLWDMATGRELIALARHTGQVISIVWSPDGTRIASASQDGTVRAWNVPMQ
jgi:WD40 repeat protein